MDAIASYGTAARGVLPDLRELIVFFDDDAKAGRFPTQLNPRRTDAVKAAIRIVEEADVQPEPRSFPRHPPQVP